MIVLWGHPFPTYARKGPREFTLDILLSAVIRVFFVLSLSQISKLLELRFGKAMLFKNVPLPNLI